MTFFDAALSDTPGYREYTYQLSRGGLSNFFTQ